MEANTYGFPLTYQALNTSEHQVRLVHIYPGTTDGMVVCTIETVSLKDKPSYEALSYEWGNPGTNTPRIKINGSLVSVRDNLWWALYHLRQIDNVRAVWIDALCINQDDILERNHQVAQMKDIYSQAVRVVVWIGQEQTLEKGLAPYQSETAIAFLYELSIGSVKDYPYSRHEARRVIFTPHKIKWDALGMLCRRSYWSRLWIVQELVLASDLLVQCGSSTFPWQVFSKVWSQLRHPTYRVRKQYMRTIITSIPFIIDTRRNERANSLETEDPIDDPSLVDLLIQFKNSSCSDIRDRIFGLESLSLGCCRRAVPVDYSLGLVPLCAKLLVHHLTKHSSIDGKETLVTTQKVLQALELEVRSWNECNSLRTGILRLKSVPKLANVSIETTACGEIVCLRSVSERYISTSGQEVLGIDNYNDPTRRMFSGSLLLSLDSFMSFTQTDWKICYLNPNSDHSCNRIISSKKCSGKFQAAPIPAAFLMKDYDKSTITNKRLRSSDSTVMPFPEGPEPRTGRKRSSKVGNKPLGAKSTETITEEDFWKYLWLQQAELWLSPHYESSRQSELKSRVLRWRELDLMLFLTSTGMTGTATRNVSLGDQVHKISGGDRQLAFLSADSSLAHVTGKGLELRPDNHLPSFPYRNPELFGAAGERMQEIDAATLLYLSGYF